jgi:hypothetical protein
MSDRAGGGPSNITTPHVEATTDGDPRTSGPGFGVTAHEGALFESLRCIARARCS